MGPVSPSHSGNAADPLQVLSGAYAESEQKDFSEPLDEDERAENYDYHSDSDLEDDEDAVNAARAPKEAIPLESDPVLASTNTKESTLVHGEWNESLGKGTIIKIHDIAFITYASPKPYRHTVDSCPDFKPFCCTCILAISSLRLMDRRRIASHGVLTSSPARTFRYLGRHQNQSTDSRTRYALLFAGGMTLD